MKINCKICNKGTNNKVYCSESCQYKGYMKPIKINICPVCNNEHVNKVHCSRECYAITDSKTKIELFTKQPHHNKGRKASIEERKKRSESGKNSIIRDPSIVERRIHGAKETAIRNGYNNGWSEETRKKRKLKPSNLLGKYGTRQCDLDFIDRYGITSIEYAKQKLRHTNETSIEKLVRLLLNKYNIKYTQEFYYNGHYFDFLLIDHNIIIECDGDYYHGYNVLMENMDNIQMKSHLNDIKKTEIIIKSEYTLIRYWEHEIRSNNFENRLIQLWQK